MHGNTDRNCAENGTEGDQIRGPARQKVKDAHVYRQGEGKGNTECYGGQFKLDQRELYKDRSKQR